MTTQPKETFKKKRLLPFIRNSTLSNYILMPLFPLLWLLGLLYANYCIDLEQLNPKSQYYHYKPPHIIKSLIIFKYMSTSPPFAILLLLLALTSGSQIQNPKSLAVTIYNNDFAIVKDTRSIQFDEGTSFLYFDDVSSRIQTQTVTFKALNNTQGIKVFQQNYEANLVDAQNIMKKYIEKDVEVYTRKGQSSIRVVGKLLGFGFNSDYIIQTKYGIQILNNIQAVTLTSLPDGFFTKPTLNWKVFSTEPVTSDCEVAYRTHGFSWKSDYTIVLNGGQTRGDVGGWVTIDNNSGKKYQGAKLKLIAGDVNIVRSSLNAPRIGLANQKVFLSATSSVPAPEFTQKSFSDFHLYTLSQPVTLNESSQKQIEFIPKVYDVNLRKYNLLSISTGSFNQLNLKASNKIQFNNSKANSLGIPLPKGTFRVFKEDQADNSLEFIGEDSIDHTPKNENITLTTGNAFDITANKYVSNSQRFDRGGYKADVNVTIANRKDHSAEVVVEISSGMGDNLSVEWLSGDAQLEKVRSGLWRVSRVFQANEEKAYVWKEDYRP